MAGFYSWTDLYESVRDGDDGSIDAAIILWGWRIHQVPLSTGRPAIILAAHYGHAHIEQRLLDNLLKYQGPISKRLRQNLLKHVMNRAQPLPVNCYLRCNLDKLLHGILDLKLFDDNIWFFLQDQRALNIWFDHVRRHYDDVRIQVEIRTAVVQSYKRGLRAVFEIKHIADTIIYQTAMSEIAHLHRAVFTGNTDQIQILLPLYNDWMTEGFEFPLTEFDRRGRSVAGLNDNFIQGPITVLQLAVLADDANVLGFLCDQAAITEKLAHELMTLAAWSGSHHCVELLLERNLLDNAYHKRWSSIVQTALKRQNFNIALKILQSLAPPFDAEFYYFWRFFENVSGFKNAGEEVVVEVWRNHEVYRPLHREKTYMSPANIVDRSMFAVTSARPELLHQCQQMYGEPNFNAHAYNYYNLITQAATESVVIYEKFSQHFGHFNWDTERILQTMSKRNVPILRLILEDKAMITNLYPQKILDICLVNEDSFHLALELMDWLDMESFLRFASNATKQVPKYFNQLHTYTQLILRSSLKNSTKMDIPNLAKILSDATKDDLRQFHRILLSAGIDIVESLEEMLMRLTLRNVTGDATRRERQPSVKNVDNVTSTPLRLQTLAMTSLKRQMVARRPESLLKLSRLAVRRAVRSLGPLVSLHDTILRLGMSPKIPEIMINFLLFKEHGSEIYQVL